MTKQKKIGIYPGTFDPVHGGHIAFALAAQQTHQLEKIVFLPELRPRNKPDVSDIYHRLTMLDQALQSHAELTSLILDEPQFSVATTLPKLQKQFHNNNLTLLIGSDTAFSLPYWPHIDRLLGTMGLIIGVRAGSETTSLDQLFEKMRTDNNLTFSPLYITADQASLCSTDIRNGIIPHPYAPVASYITANKLYQKKTPLGCLSFLERLPRRVAAGDSRHTAATQPGTTITEPSHRSELLEAVE